MTNRDKLEKEVLLISNPAGMLFKAENIRREIVEININPIPHIAFENMVDECAVLIEKGFEIANTLQGNNSSAVVVVPEGVDSSNESSAQGVGTPDELSASFSPQDLFLSVLPKVGSLLKKLIESGTDLDWDSASEEFHTMVLGRIAYQVVNYNYGKELMQLLKDAGGLIPKVEMEAKNTMESDSPISE